ncbi:MAG: carboxypeptidase regulatory-like domain-containing protein [Flavobacteriaceae bacterium]|nr:carboxypeptidase regulatory-like domain-containing protein [Flavobacteriaceae bacterium]
MIKFRLSCLILLIYQITFAQTMIFGYLKGDKDTPLDQATISLGEDRATQTKSDHAGYFQFRDVPAGTYLVIVNKYGYVPATFTFTVSSDELKKDLGEIKLEYNPSQADVGVITLSDDDLSTDEGSSVGQTGIGLLQSSRDVFSRTAAFELGAYWFRVRGTDNRYNNIMFNGIPMAKSHTGRPDFGNWGGLNNVVSYPYELAENNTVSDYSFNDLGGTTYYDTRASSYRKGLNLSYSFTNRTYQHRVIATYSTGMLASGWAFTFSGSRRWMEEGVIDGTYNDSYAYFASIEKKLSDKHRLNLTAFGTPSRRSGSSPNTQEAYDLRGKNYNAYWGWQDGEKRSERIKRIFEPIFMLTHYWDINNKTKLTTTASYQFGYNKSSRLNRFEADNPSPIYYKNLPSYWESVDNKSEHDYFLNAWKNNDTSITQVNWDRLYNANYNAPYYTDPYSGETGRRASFFLVDDVIEDKTINAATHLQTQFADNWKFFLNVNYQNLASDNYREVNDLLGADFVINKSSFLKGDGSDTSIDDYDIMNPGSVARKGDKTEYYYKLYRQEVVANATTRVNINRWDVAVSVLFGWNEAYRDGQFKHGLYADNSYGKSGKENFLELGLRAGVTYKINGRNFITINSAYYESAPTLNEIFANPRLNNEVSPDITNQKINTHDITYTLRTPSVRARATGYYTKVKDAIEISRYYAQGVSLDGNADAFISEILTGVKKDYLGAEFGIDWKIIPTLTLTGIAAVGQYTYKGNPNLYIMSDVSPGVHDYGTSYIKNYKITGTPQKGYTLGLRYSSPKYWWAGVTGNFLQDIYSDISALSRTKSFVMEDPVYSYEGATPETVKDILDQKQFQDVFMLNANIGKSFRFGQYSVGVSASVNNILNERGYVTGSFEQGRYSSYSQLAEDQARNNPLFGNKLFYDRGRSYFLNVYLRF